MPEKTLRASGARLVDALIVWVTSDRQLEAVQQPVGRRRNFAARLELPEPDEPRPAMPASSTSAAAQSRSIVVVWPAGWFACDGRLDETCDQVPGPHPRGRSRPSKQHRAAIRMLCDKAPRQPAPLPMAST